VCSNSSFSGHKQVANTNCSWPQTSEYPEKHRSHDYAYYFLWFFSFFIPVISTTGYPFVPTLLHLSKPAPRQAAWSVLVQPYSWSHSNMAALEAYYIYLMTSKKWTCSQAISWKKMAVARPLDYFLFGRGIVSVQVLQGRFGWGRKTYQSNQSIVWSEWWPRNLPNSLVYRIKGSVLMFGQSLR